MAASRVTSLSPAKAEMTGFPFSIKFTWNTKRENQSRDLKYTSVTGHIQYQGKLFHDNRIYEKKFYITYNAYNIVKIFIVPYIVIHYIFIINNCNHHGKKY